MVHPGHALRAAGSGTGGVTCEGDGCSDGGSGNCQSLFHRNQGPQKYQRRLAPWGCVQSGPPDGVACFMRAANWTVRRLRHGAAVVDLRPADTEVTGGGAARPVGITDAGHSLTIYVR